MPTRSPRAAATVIALTTAGCGFGSAGAGNVMSGQLGDDGNDTGLESGEPAPTGSTGDGITSTGATDGMTGLGTVTTPTSDPGGDDSGSSSGGAADASTTTGPPPDPCDNPPTETFTIEIADAVLGGSMLTGTHSVHGEYAYSTQGASGTVSFPFTSECGGTYWAWGFVHDGAPGFLAGDNPDSFMVHVDDGDPTLWLYGCQTALQIGNWSWETVTEYQACIEDPRLEINVPPGMHTLHVQNVEGGTAGDGGDDPGNVAAIARIVVSNDPGFAP